jgi:hypothetical protein
MIPNVIQIVNEYLDASGYDGLCNDNGQCACLKDALSPAGCISGACLPGYKAPCPGCCGEHDWHIEAMGERPEQEIDEIIETVRSLEIDHTPFGFPAIRMGELSALANEIERLRNDIESTDRFGALSYD